MNLAWYELSHLIATINALIKWNSSHKEDAVRPRSDGESLKEDQEGVIVLIQTELQSFHVQRQDADKLESRLEHRHAAPAN